MPTEWVAPHTNACHGYAQSLIFLILDIYMKTIKPKKTVCLTNGKIIMKILFPSMWPENLKILMMAY